MPSDKTVQLALALEVVMTLYLSVGTFTMSIFHVLSPTPGTGGVLQVSGSFYVDVVAAFFVLKGISYASFLQTNTDCEYHAGLIRKVFPDLLISSFLWSLVLLCTTPRELAYWVNNALSPFFVAPFFEYRANNEFRAVNEGSWLVQTQMVLFILGERIYQWCHSQTKSMNYRGVQIVLLFTWLLGFTHLAVALLRPAFISTVLRTPLTNMAFFTQGILVFLAQKHPQMGEGYQQICNSISCNSAIFWSVVSLPLLVYMHHADLLLDYPHCQHVVGDTPCLWVFDACNLRFLPLVVCLFYWGLTHTQSVFGTEMPHPTELFSETVGRLASLHSVCPTFMIHSQFIALMLHYPIANVAPQFVRDFASPLVIAEMCVVGILCWYWHALVGPRLVYITPELPPLQPYLCVSRSAQQVESARSALEPDLEEDAGKTAETIYK
jgi:hypothetical protein